MSRYVSANDDDNMTTNNKKNKDLNGFTFSEKEILNWIPPSVRVTGGDQKDDNNNNSSEEEEEDEEENDGNEFTKERLNDMTYEEVRK